MTMTPTQEATSHETLTKTGKSSTERIFGRDVTKHGYVALPNILVRGQARLGLTTTQFNILAQLLSYWIDPKRPPFPSKKELATRGSSPRTWLMFLITCRPTRRSATTADRRRE